MRYYIIIYLIGFVIAYYRTRKVIRDNQPPKNWNEVIIIFIPSLFSWIIVFIDIYDNIKLPKPPKWL